MSFYGYYVTITEIVKCGLILQWNIKIRDNVNTYIDNTPPRIGMSSIKTSPLCFCSLKCMTILLKFSKTISWNDATLIKTSMKDCVM